MWEMDAEKELRNKIHLAYKKMLDLAEIERDNGILKCIDIMEDTFSIERIGDYTNEKKKSIKGAID